MISTNHYEDHDAEAAVVCEGNVRVAVIVHVAGRDHVCGDINW